MVFNFQVMEHRPHQQPLVMVRRPQMAMGLRPHRAIRPQTIMRTVCQIMAKNKKTTLSN